MWRRSARRAGGGFRPLKRGVPPRFAFRTGSRKRVLGKEVTAMLAMRILLIAAGVVLLGSASALMAYDIYLSSRVRRLLRRH